MLTGPRIGSLFSGYGGLDAGVQEAIGGTVAWHCDFDTGPSKVLAHHWPDVPNLHDVTAVDWAAVEPVDVITGGSPCQDVSHAGKRAGMRAGTRSGLWASMCDAIDIIRPSLVVWENVRGALSAPADSSVEPCPICVGDDGDVHLRALGRVLGDLAELGYDASWVGVRASDAGAPHARFRVFVGAWPASSDAPQLGRGTEGRDDGLRAAGLVAGGETARGVLAPAYPDDLRRQGGRASGLGPPRTAAEISPAPVPEDDRREWGGGARDGRTGSADGGLAVADADISGQRGLGWLEPVECDADRRSSADGSWGNYEPAVRRWEHVLERRAPAPTEPGRTGNSRLSPRFVEWLMGLPDGHVTAVPGLTRNEQLKLLGNGVVPQQAALALQLMGIDQQTLIRKDAA